MKIKKHSLTALILLTVLMLMFGATGIYAIEAPTDTSGEPLPDATFAVEPEPKQPVLDEPAEACVSENTDALDAKYTDVTKPDHSGLTPKKYEDALKELRELLLEADPAYRQTETAANAEDYAWYAEVDIVKASREIIGDIAYLDIEAAPKLLREKILKARDAIILSTGWTMRDPEYSFECDIDTYERFFFPRFSDIFHGWDVPDEFTFLDSSTGQEGVITSHSFNGLPEGFLYVSYYEDDGLKK